jgi:hypothetical protein
MVDGSCFLTPPSEPGLRLSPHPALQKVLSQTSSLWVKSKNRLLEIQWLTDTKTLEKATLRQNRFLTIRRTGRVRVEFRATEEQTFMLRVGDTSCGFPDELDFRATDSLGLQLVCIMAEQLQGTIALERAEGTHFTIIVPLGT